MSVTETFLRQQIEEIKGSAHTRISTLLNLIERVKIHLEEDEPEAALADINQTLDGLARAQGKG